MKGGTFGGDWRNWLRSYQAVHIITVFGGIPVIAFLTRSMWSGKVTPPETLPQRYQYAQAVSDKNKEQLQALLDKAKQGKMGGHWENDDWYKAPESGKKGPWNAPVRVPKGTKASEDD
uniref:Uncharacterized protein n=1 Tax=Hemiselmis tepida TaxID=464990 RepID=A0A7S0VRP6_9CRYP|mmetsp:Transcript_25508/g.64845  ORF Transcript_25508/g.64845 Transcript_25508/m.64845 type:complete len:118 (+) Transcript_25508:90-443(+)